MWYVNPNPSSNADFLPTSDPKDGEGRAVHWRRLSALLIGRLRRSDYGSLLVPWKLTVSPTFMTSSFAFAPRALSAAAKASGVPVRTGNVP